MANLTPGFDHRVTVKFTYDKAGRKLAFRWSMRACRWFRVKLDDAEFWLATDAADTYRRED